MNSEPVIIRRPYRRPTFLYEKQKNALFNSARYSLIEATTKAGKTVGAMTWLLERALLRGKLGREFWWVAPVYPQALIAYKRFKRYLPKGGFIPNDSALTIVLPNKAILVFKSAEKPDNLYGEDVWDAVVDEASRVREDSWFAVRSTLTATKGHVRIIGNVKGRGNWFYRMCRQAESGSQDMEYHKITAMDAIAAGVLDAEEIEDARRRLPEHIFKELYLAEPSDDGGNPFGYANIQKCIAPLAAGVPAVWGIDLAKSHDWTVCIALNSKGETCEYHRWQSPWGETRARIIDLVKHTPAHIDSTGVGDPIVEDIQKVCFNAEGFKFTSQSKQQLMEGLASVIQQGKITFPDGIIARELETFEYDNTPRIGVRYSAPEGLFDDCVCALALAAYHMSKVDIELWERLGRD